MKKFLGICITLCLLMSMLAIPTLAEEVTEISFWTWRPEDTAFYDAVIADFEAANPDIKVVQNAIKNTEYNTILSAALAAGESETGTASSGATSAVDGALDEAAATLRSSFDVTAFQLVLLIIGAVALFGMILNLAMLVREVRK